MHRKQVLIRMSSSEGERCIQRSLAAEDVVAQAHVNHCGWTYRIERLTLHSC